MYISNYLDISDEERERAYIAWNAHYRQKQFSLEDFHKSFDLIFDDLYAFNLFDESGKLKTSRWTVIQEVLDAYTNKVGSLRNTDFPMFRTALSSLYGTQFNGARFVCEKFI